MSGANAYERRVNTKIDKSLVAAFGDKDIQVEPFHAESLWGGAGKHGKGAIVHHVNKEGEIDKDYFKNNPEKFESFKDEIADIFIYLVRIADVSEIDLLQAASDKMKKNESRYTVENSKGNAKKR